ncbi:DNA-binding domain-containing protein, AraC-type [Chryseobacterium populi]|uniref:DNA-binding domain-containing protein, AraC-type n=2 Tax=Chryseobacterium populi TaxID=1144316 RepID=J2KF81_9FLAO|nr:DNA-binding domain-containing protein, AraC-type [Chryseobacterium populi]
MYAYILSLTGQNSQKYKLILHFVPLVIIYLLLSDFFILPPEKKIFIYRNGGDKYISFKQNINALVMVSGVLYVSLSLLSLRKYKKEISGQYSNTEKINLNWVYYLIAGISVIWFCIIFTGDIITFISVVLFVLFAAYFGITKAGILNLTEIKNYNAIKKEETIVSPVSVKYQRSLLNEDTIQSIYTKLVYKMDTEKLFKDPDLNLDHVASLLDIHPNSLSQTINSIENKNFYDYINRQRIEEFKRLSVLPENQKFTILSLAFESGFNSKTSFNRNFKKYMNCSPREFLKNQNSDLK